MVGTAMCGRFIPKMGRRHDSRQLFLNFTALGFIIHK